MEIIADFNELNIQKIATPAILSYWDKQKRKVSLPLIVEPRGHSRRSYCKYVPQKYYFDVEGLLRKLKANNPSLDTLDQYKSYYSYVKNNLKRYETFQGYKQKFNIFQGLGKKVKIVTHCGNKPDYNWIFGAPAPVQTTRVLQEHYIYQMMQVLRTTTLNTKLLIMTYRSKSGIILGKRVALLREPKSSLAKRCKLSSKAKPQVSMTGNTSSAAQTDFINRFFYNNDYGLYGNHNVFNLYSKTQKYYVPYDFDLSGLIHAGYFKNSGYHSGVLAIKKFESFLHNYKDKQAVKDFLRYFFYKKTEMEQVLIRSRMSKIVKKDMLAWFYNYSKIMNQSLSKLY